MQDDQPVRDKKFLVYNASAGSGKTYTLVREYLRLALSSDNPHYFKRILAITFTRKAAAEMKERILLHLRILSSDTDAPIHDPEMFSQYMEVCRLSKEQLRHRSERLLRAVLHNYSELSVSTIDSFVHLIIRNFSRDLRLPMDFDVIMEKESLVEEAVDRLIDEAGRNPSITEMLSDYLEFTTGEGERWEIGVLLKKFANQILFREDSIEPLKHLDELKKEDLANIRQRVTSILKERRTQLLAIADRIVKLVQDHGLSNENFHYKNSGPFSVFLKLQENYGRIEELTINKYFTQASENDLWFNKDSKKELKAVIEKVQPALDEVHPLIMEALNDKVYFTAQLLQKQLFQLSLLHEINNRIIALKQEKDVLFMDDFNRMISDLVIHDPAPFIYERIGELYAHIMIDEFQDTSVLQWQNFIPLVENSLARGLTCLIVGDGKQSIYRFRNGEVEQFAQLPLLYGHENDPIMMQKQWLFSDNFHPETLKVNHRSGKVIVDFNNQFFAQFRNEFQHHLSSVYEELEQEVPSGREYGYVEVNFTDPSEKKREMLETQSLLTVDRIRTCIKDGFQFKDICVLVRSNKDGDKIASALASSGIPVVSPDSLLLQASRPVQLIAGMLKWLSDPSDEENKGKIVENFSSLRSPGADVLSLIEASTFKNNYNKKQIDIERFFRGFDIKVSAMEFLRFSFYQLTENIVRTLSIQREDAYVNAFLDLVFRFSLRENDLSAFLEWWEEMGEKQSVQLPDTANAVKVMTIHKSKGLQFPVVLMPFLIWESSKNGKDAIWVEIEDAFLPLRSALFPSSKDKLQRIGKTVEYQEESSRTELDQMNLLYVAFTRAEERLYLFTQRNSGFAGKKITDYLQQKEGKEEKLQIGIPSVPHRKLKRNDAELELIHDVSTPWQERLKISYESQKAWGESEGMVSARFGSLVHLLLSKINSPADLPDLLHQLNDQGALAEVSEKDLRQEMEKIFNHPFIQELFAAKAVVMNEAEMVDLNCDTLRPDKIVLFPDRTLVVDFKTGKKREIHERQIRKYGDILESMGLPAVEKCLFYTSEFILVKID